MNYLKTTLLLAVLTVLLVGIGHLMGGQQGATIAFIFALVMNFGSYWFSDKIVLAMYRAQPLERSEAPEVYRVVEELAREARIPMPRVYLIPHQTPNAFATGRNPNHAVVAVTSGILQLLDYEELKGVLAHELGHVKNRDILISSIAATIAGAIMMLANSARWAAMFGGFGGRDERDRGGSGNLIALLVVAVLAPLAAMLVQMAISRSREYAADHTGATLAGPSGLASALRKMEQANQYMPIGANPSTAHLFIVNPLSGEFLASLFSTHPPIQERIKRLEAMRR